MSDSEQGVRNRMDGRAEIALQARDVQGGAHFHGRERTLPAPGSGSDQAFHEPGARVGCS
ncbi:MAG: hypothetical protein ACRDQ4_08765 [Pseudonocardiaceae bacterium]